MMRLVYLAKLTIERDTLLAKLIIDMSILRVDH